MKNEVLPFEPVFYDPPHDKVFLNDSQNVKNSFFDKLKKEPLATTFNSKVIPLHDEINKLLIARDIIRPQEVETMGGLENLHTCLSGSLQGVDNSLVNAVASTLYDQTIEFRKTYQHLIGWLSNVVIQQNCYFQKTPTIRVHFPDQKGFDKFPRFHNDMMLGHPPGEINVWLPITKAIDGNSLLLIDGVESARMVGECCADFRPFVRKLAHNRDFRSRLISLAKPLLLNYGQIVLFDSKCLHAAQINASDKTRISLDIRLIPVSNFERLKLGYVGTGRMRSRFKPGGYYHELTTDELALNSNP